MSKLLIICFALVLSGCIDGMIDIDDNPYFCKKILSQSMEHLDNGKYHHVVQLECRRSVDKDITLSGINEKHPD